MATGGVEVMGKKKGKTPKQPTPADERVAVIVLKDTTAYREWLHGISKQSLIPVASIVRDALAKWAKDRGYPDPPEALRRHAR